METKILFGISLVFDTPVDKALKFTFYFASLWCGALSLGLKSRMAKSVVTLRLRLNPLCQYRVLLS